MYREKGPNYGRTQIGLISRADSKIQPVTRDTNDYETLTISGDGKTVATVQVKDTHSVNVLPGGGAQDSATIAPLAPAREARGVDWTADGKLLVSEGHSLMRMNSDGGQATQLLSDANAGILDMTHCGERYLVLSWAFHGGASGTRLWRTDADGSNAKQLTDGKFDIDPVCSRDGKWVYYFASAAREHPAMRVSLEGGAPEAVTPGDVPNMYGFGAGQAISPDGQWLVFNAELSTQATGGGAVSKLALVNLEGGGAKAARMFDPDKRIAGGAGSGYFENGMAFTPDGKAVAYMIREKGVDNIWVQPLDGGAGKQITNFTSEHIVQFRWSPDGKMLAVTRTHAVADVVLLREK